ncbi:hypothetical protein [Adhaeribacter pallidiroseus]|uniref:Uncharacterized protein n=1 Tax=Adhaeribacter pallidiroseus TaxID=2072847 RepID=A0A369QHT9_9BACT|nr:hypothetical protein [Adhaeribacter pallidiroseus]RDC62847.1 hypothetical protein AHMF7616_01441 [Adhaeribacter pallidiroseus]
MELNNYPTTQQEDYETLAKNLNILADALSQEQANHYLHHPETINQLTEQALQFLRKLI